ncbi:hypothetical protein QGM71_14640 [Virgibacillus sp. C22-A2]|uniref:Lipoprotein n=1 Tax=Virgibacillus tibetensis TaxID=3042313 RepID=A0ABU6KHD2_9BACI|nr:hypothetical protein [Virgibacillus sp. C22-A2]
MKIKKILAILLLVLLVFALGACNNDSNSNTISSAELTARENAILSTTSDKSFVFDFNIDSEYKEISVWIEKYELGKLVDDKLSHVTTEVEQGGSIIFATSKNDNEKKNTINIGIDSNGGTASISGFDTNSNGIEKMSSVWGNFQGKKTLNEGEVVLANISYSNDENGMSSLTADYYDDVESHMNELKEYDVAYLLKAEFFK